MAANLLYYGDNLDILRRYLKDETVDLVYLDPPFKSNQDYNVLFKEQNGSRSASQIKAFEDTWRWDQAAAAAFQEIVEASGPVSQVMQAFRMFLGDNDMLAYLSMIAPRLLELRRVLRHTGSIYLHCDPTASAHLRLLMDAVFGSKSFRNEIVWYYPHMTSAQRHLGRKHDVVLWYTKGEDYTFNLDEIREPYDEKTIRRYQKPVVFPGGYRAKMHERGKIPDDVWKIPPIRNVSAEKLGFPTQKPEALLERIIKASSNEGDTVLDPFCGCGTAIAVAQRLNRRWIGIDITYLATTLIKYRLKDAFGDQVTYKVVGEPVSLPDAQALAAQDKHQFELWALGLVGARPIEQKKGADRGIDGRLYFHDEAKGAKTKQIILSVKGGGVGVKDVRDLRGVIEREQAEIGVLLTMEEPTKPMRAEAAGAGFYFQPEWGKFPRLQILTVAELLGGKRIDYPPSAQVNVTFKKAPKAKTEDAEQLLLVAEPKRLYRRGKAN